ncbi:MAG TPA: hypothetical protein VF559_07920 [Caulobacteraceae bacterium]
MTPAAAQTTAAPPRGPTPEQVQAVQGLTPSEQARREALYGPGWQYRVAPPDPTDRNRDPQPEDLSNIDLRLRTDEISMTRLRDAELARENAVVFSIEPALPYDWEREKVTFAFVRDFHPFRAVRDANPLHDLHPFRSLRDAIMWVPERF